MSLAGKKPFNSAAKSPLQPAAVEVTPRMIETLQLAITFAQCDKLRELLVQCPQLVNHHIQTHNGACPLHLAASRGSAAMITLLIDHGADMEARDVFFNTPLHYSTSNYYTHDRTNDQAIEALLKNGADINAVNKNGIIPLLNAVRHEHDSAALILIRHGASPFEKTPFCKRSPIDEAKETQNHLLIIKMQAAAQDYKENLQKPRKALSFSGTQPRRVTTIKSFKSQKIK